MINITTRIAVEISHLPPIEFSWEDSTPQKPLSTLVVDDILPSTLDGKQLFDRVIEYVMQFLPAHFPALEDLKHLLKPASSHSQTKSKMIPMTLLQRDEKYTDETIKILHDFKADCNLTGTPQVHVVLMSPSLHFEALSLLKPCIYM